jgi:hypothetical protein
VIGLNLMMADSLQSTGEKSFRELYCEKRGCPPEQFEERVLLECFYQHGLPLARWLLEKHSHFLDKDLELIKLLAPTCSLNEFNYELENYRFYQPPEGLLRGRLRLRVSGRRLLALAKELFANKNNSQQTAPFPPSSQP